MIKTTECFVPECLNVPKDRWEWHWKSFERARFPSYQRNRSLFGRMLNQIYDVFLEGFQTSPRFQTGLEAGERKMRQEAPEIIQNTYRIAYENTAKEFAQGWQQNRKTKQNLLDELFGEDTDEEDQDQDIATLALLAVRDYFTARLFASQQNTLRAQVFNIIGTHANIAKGVLAEQAASVLGINPGDPVPPLTPSLLNGIALGARQRFRNKVTPRHSNSFSITETVTASNLGILAAAQAHQRTTGQVLSKFWLSQRDSQVRDTHEIADSTQISLTSLFNVGGSLLAFPGDWTHGAQLKEIINCRCVLIFFSQN